MPLKQAESLVLLDGSERVEVSGLAAEVIRCLAKHHHAVNRVVAEEGKIQVFYNRKDMTVSVTGLWRGYRREE